MDISSIHLAIRLYKHPREMEWLTLPDSALPDGVTDLLRLCASQRQLDEFSSKHAIDRDSLLEMLINFVDKVLLNPQNTREKQLGVNLGDSVKKYKLHYQLLMKIYHPDHNKSPSALAKSSTITKNYQSLKSELTLANDSDEDSNFVNVTFTSERKSSINSRTAPNSFYHATQKAEQNLSQTKTFFYGLSSIALLVVSLTALYLYKQDTSQLVIKPGNEISGIAAEKTVTTSQSKNDISVAKVTLGSLSNNNIPASANPEPVLERLLHKLETAYEKGIVNDIKPILENEPEIRDQSDEEITAKLETLFKITRDRKMVLYNFDWQNISGQIQGKGKFLSRYILSGEDQWQTREGIARVTAKMDKSNHLHITNLKLENNTIEQ